MNPQGDGSVGEANENNQNEEGLLEGFPETEENLLQQGSNNDLLSAAAPLQETPNVQPVLNLPQQGENNNIGAGTDVPLQQALNAPPPESNMSSSSFHVGSSSNTLNIPRKRSLCSSGQFLWVKVQTGVHKRQKRLKELLLSLRNENTNIGRRASDAPLSSQASLYFNGASTHPVQQPLHRLYSGGPISIQGGSLMPSGSSTVHNITVRTTPPNRCPHTRLDIMIPFFEHGSSSTSAQPRGPRGMNQSAAPSSSVTQNHHSPQQTPASAIPPDIFLLK
ncbi:hypothetical protein ACSQ67_007580 [Phaseolus vulgaris]